MLSEFDEMAGMIAFHVAGANQPPKEVLEACAKRVLELTRLIENEPKQLSRRYKDCEQERMRKAA